VEVSLKPAAVLVTWALGAIASAAAQEPAPAPDAAASQGAEKTLLPTRDIFDVVRDLRHKPPPPPPGPEEYKKRMVAAAPVVTYAPTSGFGIGLAGNVAFYRGYPATTRISSVVASVTATTKEQLLVNAKLNTSALRNRWHFRGDNRLYWTSQKTYGLGTGTTEDAAVDQKYDYYRFYETLFKQVGRNLYLGAGFRYSNHSDVRPLDEAASEAWAASPYVAYSERYGFDPASQSSAGYSLHALLDTRDGGINPSRGFYADLAYQSYFDGFLGGASNWEQVSYDARTYLRLAPDARHKLAFWLAGDFVTSGVPPYLDLPATGMDTYARAGRGYPQGRFRGKSLVYGEVEYRWTVTGNGLFGLVAFLNTQTLENEDAGEELFDEFATGAGVGFRVMLNKRSQTNLCFDIGWGKSGSRAVYFAVQEAF
jgi:hypothetical protein